MGGGGDLLLGGEVSYCRWSEESSVYVYGSEHDGYVCVSCWSGPTLTELKVHLLEHRNHDDKVPEYAFERIDREIKEGEE